MIIDDDFIKEHFKESEREIYKKFDKNSVYIKSKLRRNLWGKWIQNAFMKFKNFSKEILKNYKKYASKKDIIIDLSYHMNMLLNTIDNFGSIKIPEFKVNINEILITDKKLIMNIKNKFKINAILLSMKILSKIKKNN